LSAYWLPPLMVVCVGGLLAFLLLGSSGSSQAGAGEVPANLEAAVPELAPPSGSLSPVFTPEVQFWAVSLQAWAAAAGLDPNLAATVMQIESCGDPRALSSSGAIGLFQVMPYHFTPRDDPYEPDTNARRGLAYLVRSLAAASGDPRQALAGYNGGIGVIPRPESTWPLQTQRYAYWGSGIYAEASSGAAQSPRLQEWLETSGRSLCRQAARRLGLAP
jgi:hypothetical protein